MRAEARERVRGRDAGALEEALVAGADLHARLGGERRDRLGLGRVSVNGFST